MSDVVIVHTDEMEWAPSPSPTVSRKRLEHHGPPEAGRVTSVVRFHPGSAFPSHPHPDGEEIFVLEGVFSDERGDHPPGTYMLNPEGFEHAPRSAPGCVLFVKLRQVPGYRRTMRIDTEQQPWEPHPDFSGVEIKLLYREPEHAERIHLLRIAANASIPEVAMDRGEEIFVIDGTFSDEHGRYRKGTWVKYPPGSRHTPTTETGCTLYVKRDHL